MKLNLMPESTGAGGSFALATVLALVILAISLAWAAFLIFSSQAALAAEVERRSTLEPQYTAVMQTANDANAIIAGHAPIERNIRLYQAMVEHNSKYVDLYSSLADYIPSFFRVTSLAATPASDSSTTLVISGVLQTYQQYADVMLAMLRIPGAVNVTRTGFVDDPTYIPSLIQTDQIGSRVRRSEPNLPSDPIDQMYERINRASQATVSGYQGTGNFGSDTIEKGAMPGWSLVTITVSLQGVNMMAPSPADTLRGGGGASAPAGFRGPPAGMGGGPDLGGPMGPGVSSRPMGGPAGASAPARSPAGGQSLGSKMRGGTAGQLPEDE